MDAAFLVRSGIVQNMGCAVNGFISIINYIITDTDGQGKTSEKRGPPFPEIIIPDTEDRQLRMPYYLHVCTVTDPPGTSDRTAYKGFSVCMRTVLPYRAVPRMRRPDRMSSRILCMYLLR